MMFIGFKARQYWLWYVYRTKTAVLRSLIKRLTRSILCSSGSVEIPEKVIGTFIEKYMFY
jgi:IS1 family transposase